MKTSNIIFCVLTLICASCSFNLDVNKPVDLLWDKSGVKNDSVIIFLPGLLDNAETFKQKLQLLWQWLQQQESKNNLNQLYLGYGKEDKYIESITLLQNILEKKNVVTVDGKHDWVTGQKIWQQQLSSRSKTGLLQPCK